MTILFESASASALSLRILLISTTVISAAVMLKIFAPAITDFAASDVPSIWNAAVSCLRPPYLYLVINCIIITIVASSKLQSKLDDHVSAPPHDTPLQVHHVLPQIQPPAPVFSDLVPNFTDVVSNDQTASITPEIFSYSNSTYEAKVESAPLGRTDAVISPAAVESAHLTVNAKKEKGDDEFVISRSSWMPPLTRQESSDYSAEKPPASARFSHRRNIKSTPDGGKAALAVSKPKRQDTLENTWKTITEGRAIPLTRHLRKSDTWETRGGRSHLPQEKFKKSETFNERSTTAAAAADGGKSSAKLKKEPSLGQDELNRRVEAFIKKFNEEMRLQRQESLNQYREMVKQRAH